MRMLVMVGFVDDADFKVPIRLPEFRQLPPLLTALIDATGHFPFVGNCFFGVGRVPRLPRCPLCLSEQRALACATCDIVHRRESYMFALLSTLPS